MGNTGMHSLSKQLSLCKHSHWNACSSIFNSSSTANKLSRTIICKFSHIPSPPRWHIAQRLRDGESLAEEKKKKKKKNKINVEGRPNQGNQMGLSDSALESTFLQRMWVALGCGAVAGTIIKAVIVMDSLESCLAALASGFLGYVVADIGSGIYHWGIDNYGDAQTPIFGTQIEAFQGHHRRPRTITRRQFANNTHALARPAAFALIPFLLLPDNAALDAFVGVLTGCAVFSQQFHCWSHCKNSELPAIVIKLQEMGILVSGLKHAAHHRAPYNNNYCIVSGMWNPLLDDTEFFRKLEMLIYSKWAVRPRCWGETSAEWLQEGSYFGDGLHRNSSKE